MNKDCNLIVALAMAFINIVVAVFAEDQHNLALGVVSTLFAVIWLYLALYETFLKD